jgi:hypothetical protein
MPDNRTSLSIDTSLAIPMRVLCFEVSESRCRTLVRSVHPTRQTGLVPLHFGLWSWLRGSTKEPFMTLSCCSCHHATRIWSYWPPGPSNQAYLSAPHLEASPTSSFRACSSPAPALIKSQPAPAILSIESVHTTFTHHTRKRPSTGPQTTQALTRADGCGASASQFLPVPLWLYGANQLIRVDHSDLASWDPWLEIIALRSYQWHPRMVPLMYRLITIRNCSMQSVTPQINERFQALKIIVLGVPLVF